MSTLLHPTLVLAAGPTGEAIARRLLEDAQALPEVEKRRLAVVAGHESDAGNAALQHEIEASLGPMLRSGSGQKVQLDLLLVADLPEVSSASLVHLAQAASEVLARSFPVLFPPELGPQQRSVALHLILGAPALGRTPQAHRAIEILEALERWHRAGPPSPCLNRIWLLPRQSDAGLLYDEDVALGLYHFASAAFLSGLRNHQALRSRLGAPREANNLIASFSTAALQVPVGRVHEYCALRSALDGLLELSRQARQEPRPGQVHDAIASLYSDNWLAEFEEGPSAQALRSLAQDQRTQGRRLDLKLSSAPGLLESGLRYLNGQSHLLEKQEEAEPLPPIEEERSLHRADLAEAELISNILVDLKRWEDELLHSSTGLRSLNLLAQGLELLAGQMEEKVKRLGRQSRQMDFPESPPGAAASELAARGAEQTPRGSSLRTEYGATANLAPAFPEAASKGLSELKAAAQAKLSLLQALLLALPLALLVGGAFAALATSLGNPSFGDPEYLWFKALLPGLALGLCAQAAGLAALLYPAKQRLQRAVQEREQELSVSAPGLKTSREAERSLLVRQQRVAQTLAHALKNRQQRILAITLALDDAIAEVRERLEALRIRVGVSADEDETQGLFPEQTPLNWQLILPQQLPSLKQLSRKLRDNEALAAHLLSASWPKTGIEHDLPFADAEAWLEAARDQHELLLDTGPFSWPEVEDKAQERIAAFLPAAAAALSLGVRARDSEGNPLRGAGDGEVLAIVPRDAGIAFRRTLENQPELRVEELDSSTQSPRLVLLKTGLDLEVAALKRAVQ